MNEVIGITAGSFDLMHAGHVLMLNECKKHCTHLIVCLQTDPTIDRPDTKNKPVQSVFERFTLLQSCKYVDDIIVYSTEEELLTILKTRTWNKRFLGNDWINKNYTGKSVQSKEHFFLDRSHGYSTTELRNRIVNGCI